MVPHFVSWQPPGVAEALKIHLASMLVKPIAGLRAPSARPARHGKDKTSSQPVFFETGSSNF
jgi:hypothetical protein